MKVYLVEYNFWDEYELDGVYKHKETAKHRVKELNKELSG